MIIAVLAVLGLCLGSFVNAFVWRLYEKERISEKLTATKSPSKSKKLRSELADKSIATGRSMCVHCNHTLAWYDLIPVFSWLSVKGRCRYCHKGISWQYPLVEIATAAGFIASYWYWPLKHDAAGIFSLTVWLICLVMFMALFVYDIRWMILPNAIVYPLIALALLERVVNLIIFHGKIQDFVSSILAAAIGGGIFYILYQVSKGRWIGGGDVKLGYALGFLVGTPLLGFGLLFLSSLIGVIAVLPTLLRGKYKPNLVLPFGPCLLIACCILVLFGQSISSTYLRYLQG